jgi:hypothetical protein
LACLSQHSSQRGLSKATFPDSKSTFVSAFRNVS